MDTTTHDRTHHRTRFTAMAVAIVVALTLVLTGCFTGSTDSTATTDRPRPTAALPSSPTGDAAAAGQAQGAGSSSSTPATVPTVSATVVVTADPADVELGASTGLEYCVDGEYADTDWAIVASVPANSGDNRLPVYAEPDLASPVWSSYAVGETVALAPVTDFAGCAYRSEGIVFWAVWLDEGDWGWVDSFHVAPSAQPGWDDGDDAQLAGGEESDAHADCMILNSVPDTCVTVYYNAAALTFAEFPDETTYLFATSECMYGGNAEACAALTAAGYDADNAYGHGNSLSMAPTDALRQRCDTLGAGDPWGALACGELSTRS